MSTTTPTAAQSLVTKVFQAIANPNEKPSNALPADHGPSLEDHDPPEGLLDRLTSHETTRLIKSQGNQGNGMEDGLKRKGINQLERVAERSRLQHAGLFEPHTDHEDMKNLSAEHREVAEGARVVYEDGTVEQKDDHLV